MTEKDQWKKIIASARGLPTPYLPFECPRKGTLIRIKARFYLRKKGGSLIVQTSEDSENYPARTITVRPGRDRYFIFFQAAVDMAGGFMLDPALGGAKNENNTRLVWNKRTTSYLRRDALYETLKADLLRVIDPQRGRPSKGEPDPVPVPGMSMDKIATRRARKRELLELFTAIQTLITEPIERLKIGQRMNGYTREERDRLTTIFLGLRAQLQRYQKEVHDDTLVSAPVPLTAAPRGDPLGFLKPPEPAATEAPEEDWSDVMTTLPDPAPVTPARTGPMFEPGFLDQFDDTPPQ